MKNIKLLRSMLLAMLLFSTFYSFAKIVVSSIAGLYAQPPAVQQKNSLIFSAIKGTVSKSDSIIVSTESRPVYMKWLGGDTAFFKALSRGVPANKGLKLMITFEPPADFVGVAQAVIEVKNSSKLPTHIQLTGLSTNGLEGENEPPLFRVIEALGYKVDIGWKTLSNHSRSEPLGQELRTSLYKKATTGKVEIIPVARYSPDFLLPFGFYTNEKNGPEKHEIGVLAKASKFPEHQILFPALASGTNSFDPGDKPFGFYTSGTGHDAFSEDAWNILLHPGYAIRAARIFPVRDKVTNDLIKNTYLVCFEEAKNGDYNDYVFLVKNITPVVNDFTDLFDKKTFAGWNTFLLDIGKNKDPNKNFNIKDSAIHVVGKDLGYIITAKGYKNFHFKVDFKWGVAKWPTREKEKRDAGICYNIPMNEPDSIWPQSVECQIQEGDTGDFWLLGFSTITVNGITNTPMNHARMIKSKDAEKPYGEWNTVEVISYNGTCIHIVNGVEVNRGEKASITEGRILLQSEFAEIYYRNIKIRQL